MSHSCLPSNVNIDIISLDILPDHGPGPKLGSITGTSLRPPIPELCQIDGNPSSDGFWDQPSCNVSCIFAFILPWFGKLLFFPKELPPWGAFHHPPRPWLTQPCPLRLTFKQRHLSVSPHLAQWSTITVFRVSLSSPLLLWTPVWSPKTYLISR